MVSSGHAEKLIALRVPALELRFYKGSVGLHVFRSYLEFIGARSSRQTQPGAECMFFVSTNTPRYFDTVRRDTTRGAATKRPEGGSQMLSYLRILTEYTQTNLYTNRID